MPVKSNRNSVEKETTQSIPVCSDRKSRNVIILDRIKYFGHLSGGIMGELSRDEKVFL